MKTIICTLIFLVFSSGSALATEPFVVLQNRSDGGYASSENYIVKRGDTLAKIVARFYPNNTGRTELFRQIVADNPHAFLRMNPNMLLAGKVLKMPNTSDMGQDRGDDIYFF